MSSRRPSPKVNEDAQRLRAELEALKQQNASVEAAGAAAQMESPPPASSFDALNGTEQAAGSLGVHPNAWKPIKFMNNSHFDSLMKANALDDSLARRIEAFRSVAAA